MEQPPSPDHRPAVPPLLFVVLHYRTIEDTLACVATLAGQEGSAVLVVDNSGDEAAMARLRAAHPAAELLSPGRNLGWAGGNNLGVRVALERGHRAVCLLNNDTLLPPHAARRFLLALEHTGPAIVHPAIRYAAAGEGMQLDPVAGIPATTRFGPSPLLEGLHAMSTACGACMVIHRAIFERIGLIDERFFLQLEETDFAARAEAAGFRMYCDAGVEILHAESAAYGARVLPLKTYYITRNSLLIAEKHERGPAGRLGAWRRLYWTLSNVAARERPLGRLGFARWLLSGDRFAAAARAGVGHYVLRRFGPAPPRTRARLSP